jgi:hypothetical protein
MLLRTWERVYECPLASLAVEDTRVRGSMECVDGRSSVALPGLSERASAVAVVVGAVCRRKRR